VVNRVNRVNRVKPEDHTVGFRESDENQEWRKLLHHFYDPFPVVEHYELVSNMAVQSMVIMRRQSAWLFVLADLLFPSTKIVPLQACYEFAN